MSGRLETVVVTDTLTERVRRMDRGRDSRDRLLLSMWTHSKTVLYHYLFTTQPDIDIVTMETDSGHLKRTDTFNLKQPDKNTFKILFHLVSWYLEILLQRKRE